MRRAAVAVICLFAVSCSAPKGLVPSEPISSAAFREFVDDYFKAYFESNPSAATASGFHEYDDKLENYSADVVKARVGTLNSLQSRLDGLKKQTLTSDERIDSTLLDYQIKAELLELQVIQS